MSEREFEEASRLYAKGLISRRGFINKLVAGGVTVTAAVAFAGATVAGASRGGRPSGHVYGTPKPKPTGHVYGTPKHEDEHEDKHEDKKKEKKKSKKR